MHPTLAYLAQIKAAQDAGRIPTPLADAGEATPPPPRTMLDETNAELRRQQEEDALARQEATAAGTPNWTDRNQPWNEMSANPAARGIAGGYASKPLYHDESGKPVYGERHTVGGAPIDPTTGMPAKEAYEDPNAVSAPVVKRNVNPDSLVHEPEEEESREQRPSGGGGGGSGGYALPKYQPHVNEIEALRQNDEEFRNSRIDRELLGQRGEAIEQEELGANEAQQRHAAEFNARQQREMMQSAADFHNAVDEAASMPIKDDYWDKLSTGRQAMWVLSAMFSGFAGGVSGRGGNQALDQLNHEINRNLQVQKEQYNQKRDTAGEKKSEYYMLRERLGDERSADNAFQALQLRRFDIKQRSLASQIGNLDAKERSQAITSHVEQRIGYLQDDAAKEKYKMALAAAQAAAAAQAGPEIQEAESDRIVKLPDGTEIEVPKREHRTIKEAAGKAEEVDRIMGEIKRIRGTPNWWFNPQARRELANLQSRGTLENVVHGVPLRGPEKQFYLDMMKGALNPVLDFDRQAETNRRAMYAQLGEMVNGAPVVRTGYARGPNGAVRRGVQYTGESYQFGAPEGSKGTDLAQKHGVTVTGMDPNRAAGSPIAAGRKVRGEALAGTIVNKGDKKNKKTGAPVMRGTVRPAEPEADEEGEATP